MEVAMSRIGRAFTWGLSIVLGLFFVVVGASKVTSPGWAERFVDWGYPRWFRLVVAVVELGAGLALLVPSVRRFAALVLIVVMVGATATHVLHGEGPRAVVTLALTALMAALWTMSRRIGSGPDRR
jgi:putative oxidoreductase